MYEERNERQIIRKDARACFVESLNDAFPFGKAHFTFVAYDVNRPAGQRQTSQIQIYVDIAELLELCRKLECGELRYLLQSRKKNGEKTPLYQCLGGTSAEKLSRLGRPWTDGKSLSRTAQLLPGERSDFLFVANGGLGETTEKGLIVPKFGNHPENHVAVSMTFGGFSELLLTTRTHYQAWLTVSYMGKHDGENVSNREMIPVQEQGEMPESEIPLF